MNIIKNRRGFTLVETLLTIGITAILIGVVSVYLSSNNQKIKDNKLNEEMSLLVKICDDIN